LDEIIILLSQIIRHCIGATLAMFIYLLFWFALVSTLQLFLWFVPPIQKETVFATLSRKSEQVLPQ
jgi:hypothetical protein